MRRLEAIALPFIAIVGFVVTGCAGGPRMSPAENRAAATLPQDEAMELLHDYLGENPDLAQWAEGEPFYVGDWHGYVVKCESEGLVHSGGMSGWDRPGVTVVVFRKPFLPIGGGREDFFAIDRSKRMYHVRGLIGR
ncbi:MAG: hypothetical protein ACYTAS_07235 [Planctomycetota bacterium]|jgi:hypothetical protein